MRMNEVRQQLFDVVRDTYYICDGPQIDGLEPIERANSFEHYTYKRLEQTLEFGSCSVFCNNPYKAVMWQISPSKNIRMSLLCTRCREALMPDYNDNRINPSRIRECMILKKPGRFQSTIDVNNLISTSGMYNVYFFFNFVIFY